MNSIEKHSKSVISKNSGNYSITNQNAKQNFHNLNILNND